jgi:hypothetical protein
MDAENARMYLKILEALPGIAALHWPQREDYAIFSTSTLPTASTDENQHAPPFLDLPRELRDMVYIYFLEARGSAPPSPSFAGPRIFRLDRVHEDAALIPQKDIAYPVDIPQSSVHALLQVNRTVRSEVLELAQKRDKGKRPLPAELDVMATGYVLYPLWTRLPVLTSNNSVLNVTVNVRIFSPEAFRTRHGPPQLPGMAYYSFLALLNQFVTCGPAFTSLGGCIENFSPIDTLTVRLINHDDYTPRMFPPAVYEMVRLCKALALRADFRRSLRKIRVIASDEENRIPGFEGREWTYEVAESSSDDRLLALESSWDELGFSLEPQSAMFGCG